MKKLFVFMVVALWVMPVQAIAGDAVHVALEDGSVLSGELLSLQNGVYTISSGTLGTVRIDESKIRSISYGNRALRTDAAQPAGGIRPDAGMQAIHQAIVSDEQIMTLILSLQNDPEMQKVLSDPEIMNAVFSGDVDALKSHPKFNRLMNHPTIREIREKVVK